MTPGKGHVSHDVGDSIYQEVLRFTHFRRATRTTAAYLLEFEVLPRNAEARTATGGGPPEEFVPTRWTQVAASPKNENSPVLVTIQGTLALTAAAKRMR